MKKNLGFTLVELSVVIVLIGLIVAGVMGGQALLRQAKVRTLISDYNKYNTAVNAFKLEYSELPGDLSNASSYGIGTDGNGNRQIHSTNTENLDFWQHLSQSGIIAGAYTGSAPPLVAGVNVPVSSYGGNVVVHVGHLSTAGGSCLAIAGGTLFGTVHNAHIFAFGGIDPGRRGSDIIEPALNAAIAGPLARAGRAMVRIAAAASRYAPA